MACVDQELDVSETESELGGFRDPIRIQAILTANDDGTQAATVTAASIQQAVKDARVILRAANIELTFDPDSDVIRLNSTLLNRDCDPPAPGTNLNAPEHKTPPQNCASQDAERDRVARGWPGKLVVYFSSGDRLNFNRSAMMWQYGPRGFHWSNHFNEFVAATGGGIGGEVLAHEIGHYMHLTHTMWRDPKTVAEAVTAIREYVENNHLPASSGLQVFDNDGLVDTPPDPGQQLFVAAGLNPCDINQGKLTLVVPFSNGSTSGYVVQPDRENLMSYWDKTCRGLSPRLSPMQITRVRSAIETQNRSHLIAPKVLYSAVWSPSSVVQSRAIGWAFGDFSSRMQQEINAGKHLVHVQAYNIGNNQFRWDGVWEPGTTGQTWAFGWAWSDIINKHSAELAAGRHLTHMQAYDLGGGQLRWDAIWEPGNTGQRWVMGWSMQDFASVFNQMTAAGMRVVHMQAYDLGGGNLRWDATWEPGDVGTTRAIGWAMQDIATRFDQEIAAGKHCVHMQAYDLGGGNIRWDAVWENGSRDTSRAIGWAFNDFVERSQQETAAGRHLVHMQAYEVGFGQVRYDGIWERNKKKPLLQHRVLSETIYKFADRFNLETASGMRMTMMQAHTGR